MHTHTHRRLHLRFRWVHALGFNRHLFVYRDIHLSVYGHPSIMRYMNLWIGIETRVPACGCGGCARGGARVECICLRVQSPLRMHRCVYHAHALNRVCIHAWRLSMALNQPVRPHDCPLVRGGRGPHAHAVRGRSIYSTKVKALPESLGQCKLLEYLCVRAAGYTHARTHTRTHVYI